MILIVRTRAALAALTLAALAVWSGAARAGEPDCYEVAQRIVGAGLQIRHVGHVGSLDIVDFDDALKSTVMLRCDNRAAGIDVSLAYKDRAAPPPLWLGLAALLGSVTTGASKSEVATTIARCMKQATAKPADADGQGEADSAHVSVDCQVYPRVEHGGMTADGIVVADAGGGYVDIYLPDGSR